MSKTESRLSTVICGLVFIGVANPSFSATTIDFVLKQQGQAEVNQAAYIDDGKALIKAAGGDPNMDLLFRQEGQTMTIINHLDKSTLDLDAEKVSSLAGQASGMMDAVRQQLMAQMEKLPEEQREQLKSVIEGLGGGQLMQPPPAPPAPRTLKETGVQKVNGFTCSKTEVYEGSEMVAEVCSAPADVLGIPDEDFAVIESMREMSRMLREETAKISSQMGQAVPQFGDAEVSGVPIVMKDRTGNTMTISGIRQGIGDARLEKPQGYTVKQMPSLPQLIQ